MRTTKAKKKNKKIRIIKMIFFKICHTQFETDVTCLQCDTYRCRIPNERRPFCGDLLLRVIMKNAIKIMINTNYTHVYLLSNFSFHAR